MATITTKSRKLYSSSNGDSWYLVLDSGEIFVRHEANAESGGHVSQVDLGKFLSSGRGPEQQELLRLLGTLVDDDADADTLA